MEGEGGKYACARCKSKFNTQIGLDQHMAFRHGIELLLEIQRMDEQVGELREQQKFLEPMEPMEFKDIMSKSDQERKSLKKLLPLTFKFVRGCQKKRNAIRAALQTIRL